MRSRLPLEIQELVIEHCEPHSLMSTCLVSRAWFAPSRRAYFKQVDFELVPPDLPQLRRISRSVSRLVFKKITIVDHNQRVFEPFLAVLPAVDALRVYSALVVPISISNATLAGLSSLELGHSGGDTRPLILPLPQLCEIIAGMPRLTSLGLIWYKIPYVQGQRFQVARAVRPFSLAFAICESDRDTLLSLEPFLAALRPDSLHFIDLGELYSSQELNRIFFVLCKDLKHVTLQWRKNTFFNKVDQICASNYLAGVSYSPRKARVVFPPGNIISSLALFCGTQLDVFLDLLSRQPLPFLHSLGLGPAHTMKTADVESFDKDLISTAPLFILLHCGLCLSFLPGRQHIAHMLTLPNRRHKWELDEHLKPWLELGCRFHEMQRAASGHDYFNTVVGSNEEN
ncbi:hypothetical protein C8R45DRAFT_955490 [Mycena sanguinolenta]|nr:hypothetical protein C8R45DRAFT_955490 [Mycena sanguinolenta]